MWHIKLRTCTSSLWKLCHFYFRVPHTGIKPVSAGLEAAAQSLYQWDKYNEILKISYFQYWYNKIFFKKLILVEICYLVPRLIPTHSFVPLMVFTVDNYSQNLTRTPVSWTVLISIFVGSEGIEPPRVLSVSSARFQMPVINWLSQYREVP